MVLIVMGTEGGLGRHIDTLSQTQITQFFKMNFIQLVTSTLTGIALVKLSVGFSLLRLIRTGWYAWVVWGTMGKSSYAVWSSNLPVCNFLTLRVPISLCCCLYHHGPAQRLSVLYPYGRLLGPESC